MSSLHVRVLTLWTLVTSVLWLCGVVWNTSARKESLLQLEDEDSTSVTEEGWKRINTLAHYNVQDNSVIHLVYDKRRINSVADGEPHVLRNIDGLGSSFK